MAVVILEGEKDTIQLKLDTLFYTKRDPRITQSHIHPTFDATNNSLVIHWCIIVEHDSSE